MKRRPLKDLHVIKTNKQKEEHAKLETAETPRPDIHPTVPVSDDLYQLTLPQFLADLKVLAIDPCHRADHNVSLVVGQGYLNFRSLVYQKSKHFEPVSSKGDKQELPQSVPLGIVPLPPVTEETKKQIDVEQRVKQGSLFKRSSYIPDIPARTNWKRPISDRQEESSSAKRTKKLDQLKLLAREKKAAIKESDVASKSSPSASTPGTKQRQEQLEESPTIVNLKFPRSSMLPSIANLKARLVRFGPLIVDQCKVSWKMHSCQVKFKYKADALEACSHVKEKNFFGQVEVACSAEEFGLQCSQIEPVSRHLKSPPVPPKSILKQPSDSVIRKKNLRLTGKEKLRVKFRLPTDDNVSKLETFLTPPPSSIRLSKMSNSSTFLHKNRPLPPPLPPLSSRSLPLHTDHLGESRLCQLMQQYGGNVTEGENKKENVDISQQLLSTVS